MCSVAADVVSLEVFFYKDEAQEEDPSSKTFY